MKKKAFVSLLVVIVLSMAAILPASADSHATLYVIHGINGVDLGAAAALPVDIAVNGSCALTDFEFTDIAGPLALPAGMVDVEVFLASPDGDCVGSPVIAVVLDLMSGKNYTAIAHLDAGGAPTASLFENDLSSTGRGMARAILHHTAYAPAVDVRVARSATSRQAYLLEDLANGSMVQADVRPGDWYVSVMPAGSMTPVLGPLLVTFKPYYAFSYYVVGSVDNGLSVIGQTFSGLK